MLTTESVARVDAVVIGEEWGFTGVVARLHVHYCPGHGVVLPNTIIAKLPHADRSAMSAYQRANSGSTVARRAMLGRAANEVRFYAAVERGRYPQLPASFYGAVDAETSESVLLLEDLSGGRVGDALSGCSAGDAERVLRAIASIHAAWWRHPSLDAHEWLVRSTPDAGARQRRYSEALPRFLGRYGRQVPSCFLTVLDALDAGVTRVIDAAAKAPVTLVHADLHLDNVIFMSSDTGSSVRIIDWQSVTRGPAALDVAMFLSGSIGHDEIAASTEYLLAAYHRTLVHCGVADYSHGDLMRDYRISLLRLVIGVVIWLGNADLAALSGRELALVEAAVGNGRLIAAVESQNLLSAIPN
jgi:hypothetical protein